jgi:diketogulonate reductase-like aldo/keto reductase
MYSLIHTSDESKRLGYVNQNLINQIELNPQINENNTKYKNMRQKSKIAAEKNSPMTKGLLLLPT